ncbi:4-amino-4-deoxy-alpha-L-arabinopyranosyl undecaprenyl phosphate biosynthetic process [Agyrium rufum]|nr:4-amino-4-deoxy-alpha-L-arabinopyranosyl undecaprenyl phosphate biosynthetic process [Agyrium rufum]
MGKRAYVVYCIDTDACAPWLSFGNGKIPDSTSLSRGVFGATTGLDRLLDFFKRNGDMKATFNIPSHTIESFPEQTAKIFEAGHEIGLHGYSHEPPSALTEEQERAVLVRSIEVYKKFTGGRHPAGYIAPNWSASSRTIRLLEEHGIRYDHSLMAHDSLPHWAADLGDNMTTADFSKDAETWMKPMSKIQTRNVVEIPGNWDCTDFVMFNFIPDAPGTHGYVSPYVVEQNWKDMFTALYQERNESSQHEPQGFVFPLTIHPQSSGKPHILAMHQRFVDWLRSSWEGVEFVTCEFVADEFRAGRLKGWEMKGGV